MGSPMMMTTIECYDGFEKDACNQRHNAKNKAYARQHRKFPLDLE
jgi:hypothetical protein